MEVAGPLGQMLFDSAEHQIYQINSTRPCGVSTKRMSFLLPGQIPSTSRLNAGFNTVFFTFLFLSYLWQQERILEL